MRGRAVQSAQKQTSDFPLLMWDIDEVHSSESMPKHVNTGGLNLTLDEIRAAFEGSPYAELPVLNLKQVSDLLQVPVDTLYQWSSQGYFKNCAQQNGKHLLFFRDRLLQTIFNED